MPDEAARKAVAALSPEMRRLFADQWVGTSTVGALIQWATDQLLVGKDSPALRILAGLNPNDSREVRDYFQKALKELAIPFPEEALCMMYRCGDIAQNVLAGSIEPLKAFATIWQISVNLNHPGYLRCWMDVEIELDTLEYHKASVADQENAVRHTCDRFIALLDSYTETGILRLSLDRSLAALRSRGLDTPAATDDDGLTFFRTLVYKRDFRDLTVPSTAFLRSKIADCDFQNADLSQSSMTWCDWNNCNFWYTDLRRCDLRRSIFRHCSFYYATLDDADLRGARFEDCQFGYARMNGTKLEKRFGFSTLRRRQLKLSPEQAKQISWTATIGPEPEGG